MTDLSRLGSSGGKSPDRIVRGPDEDGFARVMPDDERLAGAAAGRMHEDVDPVEALTRMQAGLTDLEHVGAAELDGEPV